MDCGSGPGAARTILLFHTISAGPSKQPRMVGSTLGVYSFGLIFVSARTNKRQHHLSPDTRTGNPCGTHTLKLIDWDQKFNRPCDEVLRTWSDLGGDVHLNDGAAGVLAQEPSGHDSSITDTNSRAHGNTSTIAASRSTTTYGVSEHSLLPVLTFGIIP